MERVTSQPIAEAIAAAFDLLPEPVARRLEGVHFFTSDPVLAGVHSWDVERACRDYLREHDPATVHLFEQLDVGGG